MTRDDIIRMAREANIIDFRDENDDEHVKQMVDMLEHVVALAAAAEREACAKVCEARYMGDNNREDMEARRCSAAIRARSNL